MNTEQTMTRLDFFFTAHLTDPECEPRHVATVIVTNSGQPSNTSTRVGSSG